MKAILKVIALSRCKILQCCHNPFWSFCPLQYFFQQILCLFNARLEAAMQRLTNLCSVLNDMEPICVLNHVFVLREVCILRCYLDCFIG